MCERPLGERVEFSGALRPDRGELRGPRVVLRPIDVRCDAEALYEVSHAPTGDPSVWTYLYDGPYPRPEEFRAALQVQADSVDPCFYVVTRAHDGRPLGVASYLAIVPEHGTVEIGNIWFAPEMQRSTAATEAIHLLARNAFDVLGNRRLEWKCNALNEPSRRAAIRFGFEFEGVFAQHRVVKGRNRDTAWYAITDRRWPAIAAGFERWLANDNFDSRGHQRRRLRDLIDEQLGERRRATTSDTQESGPTCR